MKFLKTSFFFLLSIHASAVFSADAETLFRTDKITSNLQNGGSDLILTVDNILGFLLGLIYFVAIIITIYGGFLILTSGGEEDKMKKGKNYFIYALLGIIVIFLASQVVRWVISVMSDTSIVGS